MAEAAASLRAARAGLRLAVRYKRLGLPPRLSRRPTAGEGHAQRSAAGGLGRARAERSNAVISVRSPSTAWRSCAKSRSSNRPIRLASVQYPVRPDQEPAPDQRPEPGGRVMRTHRGVASKARRPTPRETSTFTRLSIIRDAQVPARIPRRPQAFGLTWLTTWPPYFSIRFLNSSRHTTSLKPSSQYFGSRAIRSS